MQFRDHPAVQGKRDMYPVDPRKLKVDDNYNVRDMQAKETRDHIAWLKASIIAGGVHTPLEVRLDGKNIFVVAGHCRLAAVLEAIEEGHPIATVPCIPEAKGTDEIDRTVNLVISNSGKPLSPLEIAKVVKRLSDYGWEPKQIAERLGWKSVASVKQHLEMLELSEPVKQHIRSGKVSATTARHLAKSDLSAEQQDALIRANEEENARIRGKKNTRTKVTRKTLNRNKPQPEKASARSDAQAPPAPAPAPAAAAETVSALPPMPQTFRGEPFDASTDEGREIVREHLANMGPVVTQPSERMPAPSVEQPPVSLRPVDVAVRSIRDFIEALKPFHDAINDIDTSEFSDDDTIPIPVKHLKRAFDLYSRSIGDDIKSAA